MNQILPFISNKIFTNVTPRYSTKTLIQKLHIWFILKHFRYFRNFYSSHSPSSFLVEFSLSDIHPTTISQPFARTFFCSWSFSPAPVISFNRANSSSSTRKMTSKTIMKSTSSQTNTTVPSYNAHSLKAAIFKTLALKVGNELNNGTIAPPTRRAFFKIKYNVFSLSSKRFLLNSTIDSTFPDPMLLYVKRNLTMSLFYLIRHLMRTIVTSYTPCKKLLMLLTKFSKILDFSND